MKWLILTVIVVCALFLMGWVYVENNGNRMELILDKNRVEQDTGNATDKAGDAIEGLGDKAEEAGDEIKRSTER